MVVPQVGESSARRKRPSRHQHRDTRNSFRSRVVVVKKGWLGGGWRSLGLDEGVPATHLLAPVFSHVIPVRQFFVSRGVEAQGEPADHFLALHAALVVDGDHQSDVGQLEQRNLQEE